jgi:hypothetical protein
MRSFKDGDTITVEPWRAGPFPVIKDLVVDRGAFDRIIQAGGYVSTKTGPHPDGNAIPIGKDIADQAFEWLDAPVRRLGGLDVPIPFSPTLEDAYRPSAEKIYQIAKELAEF